MITEEEYNGWKSAVLSNGEVELIAPLEIGPRIMSLRLRDGENLLYQFPDQQGGKGEPGHKMRGGHRLWHSPENPVRTYQPDNDPVKFSRIGDNENGISLTGPAEGRTGFEKSIEARIVGARTVKVSHRLTNLGLWPVECAAWPITILRRGGTAALPFPAKGAHPRDLLPSWAIVPWTYTDLSAPCWQFHSDFLEIDSRETTVPQKLGLTRYPGWSAYWLEGVTFIKYAAVVSEGVYPDLGCCMETFCNEALIELETLSPLRRLDPEESLEHVEFWGLLSDLSRPESDEAYRDGFLPAVRAWLETVSAP